MSSAHHYFNEKECTSIVNAVIAFISVAGDSFKDYKDEDSIFHT